MPNNQHTTSFKILGDKKINISLTKTPLQI